MDKNEMRSLTPVEKKLVDEACKLIFEMEERCHSDDRHVVEKMIKYGYRQITQK